MGNSGRTWAFTPLRWQSWRAVGRGGREDLTRVLTAPSGGCCGRRDWEGWWLSWPRQEILPLDQVEREEGGEAGRFGIEFEGRLRGFHLYSSSVRHSCCRVTGEDTEAQRGQGIWPGSHSWLLRGGRVA